MDKPPGTRRHLLRQADEDIDEFVEQLRSNNGDPAPKSRVQSPEERVQYLEAENHRLSVGNVTTQNRVKECCRTIESLQQKLESYEKRMREFAKLVVFPEKLALMDAALRGRSDDEDLSHLFDELQVIIKNTYADFTDVIGDLERQLAEQNLNRDKIAALDEHLVLDQSLYQAPADHHFSAPGTGPKKPPPDDVDTWEPPDPPTPLSEPPTTEIAEVEGPPSDYPEIEDELLPEPEAREEDHPEQDQPAPEPPALPGQQPAAGPSQAKPGGKSKGPKPNSAIAGNKKKIVRWCKEMGIPYQQGSKDFDLVVERDGRKDFVLLIACSEKYPPEATRDQRLEACLKQEIPEWCVIANSGGKDTAFDLWIEGWRNRRGQAVLDQAIITMNVEQYIADKFPPASRY